MDVNGARRAGSAGPLEVITSRDSAAWDAVLAGAAEYDFHHLAGYHRLAEYRGEGTGFMFAYRSAEHLVAVPLLLRPIDPADPSGRCDATSVYGYAGPITSPAPLAAGVVDGFQSALRDELLRRRIVAVFSRLHPLLEQHRLVAGLGEIRPCGSTVSIDLTLDPELQWAGYSKGTRRLVRRAKEAGVTCLHDTGLQYLGAWADLYRETMERVGASSSYLYDRAYFERMAAELGPAMQLFVALVDGDLAAAGVYTICDGIVQAHLGGSRARYGALSPGRLVDDTARRWGTEVGARVFHLGGGVGCREDSLFRYKAGFSDRRHEFATWRWIVDEAAYADLCRRHGPAGGPTAPDDGGYFPDYRRPAG